MKRGLRRRFWVELVFALIPAGLAILTIFVPEWIELVFHVDPDEGSGSLELAVTLAAAGLMLASIVAARIEWRHRLSVDVSRTDDRVPSTPH